MQTLGNSATGDAAMEGEFLFTVKKENQNTGEEIGEQVLALVLCFFNWIRLIF